MSIKVGDILNFAYTGAVQSITLPKGKYQLECWGAQGGYRSDISFGGKGGKSYGILTLTKPTILYIYVGGSGRTGGTSGGFNGGGSRPSYYGGGGASDIRIGTDSLYARVIVAGGGGSDGAANRTGMYGGGASGGSSSENYGTGGGGGTQTAGGTGGNGNGGTFGKGGAGLNRSFEYGGAGGGGWYGGGGAYPDGSGDDDRGGGGGSGFVWTGSNAPSGYLLGAEYHLANAVTKAGNLSFDAVSSGKETGHSGDGHVRITVNEIQSLNIPSKISGTWKNSAGVYAKINGIWKNVDSIYTKINGVWKQNS